MRLQIWKALRQRCHWADKLLGSDAIRSWGKKSGCGLGSSASMCDATKAREACSGRNGQLPPWTATLHQSGTYAVLKAFHVLLLFYFS